MSSSRYYERSNWTRKSITFPKDLWYTLEDIHRANPDVEHMSELICLLLEERIEEG